MLFCRKPNHQAGFTYDRKRDLLYIADAHAQVFALRLDPKTAVIKTFAEIAAEAAAGERPAK